MYAHEYDEWRRDIASMTEMQRAATQYETRAAMGMCGDREDAMYQGEEPGE